MLELPPHAAAVLIDKEVALELKNQQLDALIRTLRHVWVGTILAIVHGIWVWRLGLVLDAECDAQVLRVKAHERVRQRVQSLSMTFMYSDEPTAATAERTVLLRLLKMGSAAEPPRADAILQGPAQYICFFDGGSRGNPGPGGSGSVIVAVDRVTRATEVVWFACMAYGSSSTTNNVAEYWGLVHGLQYANKTRRRPLHVVGDSSLIIHQVKQHKRPKAKHLMPLHKQATRMAAAVGVATWSHHLRAFNKMADAAANIAMDDARFLQSLASDARPELHLLLPYVSSDIQHWLARQDSL